MTTDYTRHLEVAIAAARTAGEMIRAEFLRPGGPRGKGGHAEIDEIAEKAIREALFAAFSGYGYRGEETGFVAASTPTTHLWLVDPNDGTAGYLKGFRESAVSIALLRDGVPVLGVVFAPLARAGAGDLIAWAEGQPLTRNGHPVQRPPFAETLGPQHTVLISQHADKKARANADLCAPARFRAMASIAYRLALVAVGEGELGVSFAAPCGWDYAAGDALLRAVSGLLIDGCREPVRYTTDGRSSSGGACFGGSPAITRAFAGQNWSAIIAPSTGGRAQRQPSASETQEVFPYCWPERGVAVADHDLLRRAQGCLIGTIAGDALGSLVEFQPPAAIRARYQQGVTELADGGRWHTLAGQCTDDTELALMLARSIVAVGKYDVNMTARAYRFWLGSGPFDVGGTTHAGISAASRALAADRDPIAEVAAHGRGDSMANGALMRIAPLAVWGHALSADELARLARLDAGLTHPNPTCTDANAVFVVALQAALHGADADDVYRAAVTFAADSRCSGPVIDALAAARSAPA